MTKTMEVPALTEQEQSALKKFIASKMDAADQENMSKQDIHVLHEGRDIKLPADPTRMSIPAAINALERQYEEEEQLVNVSENINAMPWDGAVAFVNALRTTRGWFGGKTLQTFFGPKRPNFIGVPTSVDQTVQVIWGAVEIPGIEGYLETGMTVKRGQPIFCITGEVKKKHLREVKEIAEATRRLVETRSIYKGKAIRINVKRRKPDHLDLDEPCTFLDVEGAQDSVHVFNNDVGESIKTNLWGPIMYPKECQQLGIPLKRGVLLEGPYGTGKTQTAFITAEIAQQNGWTFLLLESVTALAQALALAKQYQPCVVFAEDIDRVVFGDDRTVSIDDVLNTIDGVEAKNTQIMTVLTTNHVENINKAMLRPGRLDAVISVDPPNADTAARLVEAYAGELIEPGTDFAPAGEALAGHIPATIRECVERAKLHALAREGHHKFKLQPDDVVAANVTMQTHLKLLENKPEPELSAGDRIVAALAEILADNRQADKTIKTLGDVAGDVEVIKDAVA